MAKDYNIMAGAGISDQDFVDMQGLPQELAQTADLHLWMTYKIYLGNKELDYREFLMEINVSDKYNVYCDNQSAIKVSRNDLICPRSKHIHIRMNFVYECIESGLIDLHYINTEHNVADALSKPTVRNKLDKLVRVN